MYRVSNARAETFTMTRLHPSNPCTFAAHELAELPEICAIGFRNPWRCGFDSLTDELYCGNVGHENIESIYIVE